MIELRDVTVTIDGAAIVEGVSFAVNAGEVVGVIGPNGAGKTSLLRTIAGILDPARGTIQICGDPGETLSTRERARRIAVLSQSTDVHFDFSVRDIVAMGRTPYVGRLGSGDERATHVVESALERTQITHLADRSISAVSGGERQRVLLSRALAQETPVLLLDEPTANLDVNHQIGTFELVRDLAEDGKTILAAIHDLDLAARYCDRLVLLASGDQLAMGAPNEVLTSKWIERAYGTRAAVRPDPLTGAVGVTALADRPNHPDVRVHVIGNGGAGGPICRRLDRAGYAVSVGIVSEGGPDHEVAMALDLPTVALPPAAPIDEATRRAHRDAIEEAAVTVVAPFHIGPPTLGLLTDAEVAERALLVDEPPFAERNHAGQAGWELWNRLRARYTVVAHDRLLSVLAERLVEEVDPRHERNPSEGIPADREI